MKEGKIFVKKDKNNLVDIHPLLKVGEKNLVITHKPPVGVRFIKLTNKDVYGLEMEGGQTYVTNESIQLHKEKGHIIGGVKKKKLNQIIKSFKFQ